MVLRKLVSFPINNESLYALIAFCIKAKGSIRTTNGSTTKVKTNISNKSITPANAVLKIVSLCGLVLYIFS